MRLVITALVCLISVSVFGQGECDPEITWTANGQQFYGDASAYAGMDGTSIFIAGISLTTAQIGFTIAEPVTGWVNGVVITMNLSTAPGTAGAYDAIGGAQTYSTYNGGNITMELNYVVSGAGGYVTGTFSGNMQSTAGAAVTISQGSFSIPFSPSSNNYCGCALDGACNYNPNVFIDDGSCVFIGDPCDDGNSNTLNDSIDDTCECVGEEATIYGCMNINACNYNPIANQDNPGICIFIGDPCDDGNSNTVEDIIEGNCECMGTIPCNNQTSITYQGYEYDIVQIGDQCWFAENCRYLPSVSPEGEGSVAVPCYHVYNYDGVNVTAAKLTDNYETYGVLYNWPAVMTEEICPSGWHIASDEEWMELEMFLGMSESEANGTGYMRGTDEGYQMKSVSGWYSGGNGSNSSGFNGLPGGWHAGFIFQKGDNYSGCWWTSSVSYFSGYETAWGRCMDYGNDRISRFGSISNMSGHSARCIQNSSNTSIFSTEPPSRKLEKVIDALGREVNHTTNQILFHIYDDGSVEKKFILE